MVFGLSDFLPPHPANAEDRTRKLLKSLKGATARAANKFPIRTGQPFWQDESFDRWIRNEAEFNLKRQYIEHNPVTARLASRPDDWPWPSATPRS